VADRSNKFRISVQRRTKPIGNLYIRHQPSDDRHWGMTTAEYFFTPEEALAAGRAVLDRLKRGAS
jgi:phosphatidylserine/phosphatidylglycerophosphate/cardiolipin synthase-like enzyme